MTMNIDRRGYLSKLAVKILFKNRIRTSIGILAIAMACILFTTLFFIATGLVNGMEFQSMKAIGTVSHGAFKGVTAEDMKILAKDSKIKAYGQSTTVGILSEGKVHAEMIFRDQQALDWTIMESMEGRYPKTKREILIDLPTLKALGYQGKIGEEIVLSYDVTEKATSKIVRHRTDRFTVVGIYLPPIDSTVSIGQIYISKDDCEEVKPPEKNHEMTVQFSNTWNIKNKMMKVADRNGYQIVDSMEEMHAQKTLGIGINHAYLSNGESFDFLAVIIPCLVMASIVMLAGYLFIHNIFQLAVMEDTQLYGLLKTVGTTTKQIKKLVRLQGTYLLIPAVLLGECIGIILGHFVLRRILSTSILLEYVKISGAWWLFIVFLSAIFSGLTVYFSCRKPATIASKISPIDSLKWQEDFTVQHTKNQEFSIHRVALRQVFAKKFQFLSIVISLSLSALLLNSLLTYTENIDLKKGVADNICTDYNVANSKYFIYHYQSRDDQLKKEYIEEIKQTKGFQEGGGIYAYGSEMHFPDVMISGRKTAPTLFGMDTFLLKKQTYLEGSFDLEKWNTGEYAYIGQRKGENSDLNVGDQIEVHVQGKRKKVTVLGKINYGFSNGLRYFLAVDSQGNSEQWLKNEFIFLSPKTYMELTGSDAVMSYGFDIRENNRKDMEERLQELERNQDFQYDSRQKQMDSFQKSKNTYEFVGYMASAILFVIGMLNFINILSMDIAQNKIYLSILEALGMTRKKILSYLLKKSMIYSVSGLMISLLLNLFFHHLFLKDWINSLAWTNYSMKIQPLIFVNICQIVIGILFTKLFYEIQSRDSLTERIKGIKK